VKTSGVDKKLQAAALCTPITPRSDGMIPSAAADVIFSERVTVHSHWGGNLFLVTLIFDLDIQTRPS